MRTRITLTVLIALTLAGCSGATEVPDVVGMAVPEAVEAIETAGYEVHYPAGGPDERMADHWTVYSQSPDADKDSDGDEVMLWVGTPITRALDECSLSRLVDPGDGGTSVLLDGEGEDVGSGTLTVTQIACVLNEVDIPDSVVYRIDDTRALDGRQNADWDGMTASWSYHPDSGLDLVLELDR